MRPDKKSITDLFTDRSQYLIPLFQRGYVWTLTDQIQPLWEDITDRVGAMDEFKANAKKVGGVVKLKALRKHFLGTVVIGSAKGGGSDVIATREVIDGQQRITTLQILLLAFRDAIRALDDEGLSDDLKRVTRNIGKYRDKSQSLKVWPTNVGRDVMQALAELESFEQVCQRFPVKVSQQKAQVRPLMVQAYLFFYASLIGFLRGLNFDDPRSMEKKGSDEVADVIRALIEESSGKPEQTISEAIIRSIDKENRVWLPGGAEPLLAERAHLLLETLRDCFQVMSLELEDEDDPQIIFETLNARGAPLQPSDLIRNFVFLHATRRQEDVDSLYDLYWKDFDDKPDGQSSKGAKFWRLEERQGRLKSIRLDLLMYHYVGLRRAEELKVAHVFEEFKDWWESEERDTDAELQRIAKLARHFEVFLEPNQSTRFDLFCRRMKLLDTSTLTPLVFYFLEHHEPDSVEFIQILDDLESYMVRRFVCGYTTKGYNRIFMKILAEMSAGGDVSASALRKRLLALAGDSQLWPEDMQFHDSWCARSLYRGRNTKAVRAILEAIELNGRSSRQEYQSLPELSVEHVLPQKWEAHWPLSEASPEQKLTRERLLHSIGNLTLVTQEFNSSLSNEAFRVKRKEIVTKSLLRLNAYFQSYSDDDVWDEPEIIRRAESLVSAAKSIWARPQQ